MTRRRLEPHDIRVRDGLAVTSPARTLLDLAASPIHDLERIVGDAIGAKLVTETELRALVERSGGRRGVKELRAVLEGGPAFTRSEAERRFLGLVRAAGLPKPAVNTRVAGLEVDFLWAEQRLVVEVDGHAFHALRPARERDYRRDAQLDDAGFDVMRISWGQITEESEKLLVRLTRRLVG